MVDAPEPARTARGSATQVVAATAESSESSPPRPTTLTPGERRRWDLLGLLLVLIVTLGEFARFQLFYAWLPLINNGDVYQHVWWMLSWQDPQLFRNDLLFRYFSDPALSPLGHRFLYWLASQVGSPLTFAMWLPLPMFLVGTGLVYLLGRHCGGRHPLGGIAALVVFVLFGMGYEYQGGFARTHGLNILAIVALGWVKRDGRWVGAGLIYGGLFYPPVTALAGFITLVVVAADSIRARSLPGVWRQWRQPVLVVLGGLIALGLLMWFRANELPAEFLPRTTAEQARQMPEFYWEGRNAFWIPHDPWLFFFHGDRTGMGVMPRTFALLATLVVASIWLLPRAVPMAAWVLILGSYALWATAHAVLFALYLPSRYLTYSLPLFVMMWIGAVAPRCLAALRRHRKPSQLLDRLRQPAVGCTLLLVLGAAYGYYQLETARGYIPSQASPQMSPGLGGAYDYLQSLPKDTLVAAHPYDADPIPMLARRSVLAGHETSLAYHMGFYSQVKPRITDSLAAFYAFDWPTIERLHERYGVEVMMVNSRRYEPFWAHYHEPWYPDIVKRLERGKDEPFAALHPPPDRLLYDDGDITLLWLGPLEHRPPPHPSLAAEEIEPAGNALAAPTDADADRPDPPQR